MSVLPDARARLLAGVAGLALASAAIDTDAIGPVELRLFRTVNRLPDGLAPPMWLLMQSGNLVAAPVTAAVAAACGRPRLARRLLLAGATTWVLAKVVKRWARRPRPTTLLTDVRGRGRPQSGLGFVSGHTAVAVGLCAAALPDLSPAARRLAIGTAAVVGASRIYVGAHLPLDVIGGAALGVAVEAALEL